MLSIVVMFEGFDISVSSVVLPYLAQDFGASEARLGGALSVIALGAIAAWLTIRLADRFGRRPVLILAAAGFSLGSLATTLSFDVTSYAAIQFITRVLLVTQIATAYILISEIIPPRLRGRANGALGASGSIGAALPFLLLDTAVSSEFGWRLLFVIGAAPLLAVPLLLAFLPETPAWKKAREAGVKSPSLLHEVRELVSPALRRNFLAMSALWFLINFASAVAALFFTLYAVQERGWQPADFASLAILGLIGSFLGYVTVGWLMDAIGRRPTVMILMTAVGVLTQLCYTSEGWWAVAGAFVGIQATLGVWVAAYTLNSELFPTHLRSAANGWCHNLVGRWGFVLAPLLLGGLAVRLGGIGVAATLLGCAAYLAVPLVWFGIEETRAKSLDTVDA